MTQPHWSTSAQSQIQCSNFDYSIGSWGHNISGYGYFDPVVDYDDAERVGDGDALVREGPVRLVTCKEAMFGYMRTLPETIRKVCPNFGVIGGFWWLQASFEKCVETKQLQTLHIYNVFTTQLTRARSHELT